MALLQNQQSQLNKVNQLQLQPSRLDGILLELTVTYSKTKIGQFGTSFSVSMYISISPGAEVTLRCTAFEGESSVFLGWWKQCYRSIEKDCTCPSSYCLLITRLVGAHTWRKRKPRGVSGLDCAVYLVCCSLLVVCICFTWEYRCLSADVLVSLRCSIELDWIHSVCLQGCILGMQEVILF